MKRGCEVIALHFNASPFSGSQVTHLACKLVDKLQNYAKGVPIKMYIVVMENTYKQQRIMLLRK